MKGYYRFEVDQILSGGKRRRKGANLTLALSGTRAILQVADHTYAFAIPLGKLTEVKLAAALGTAPGLEEVKRANGRSGKKWGQRYDTFMYGILRRAGYRADYAGTRNEFLAHIILYETHKNSDGFIVGTTQGVGMDAVFTPTDYPRALYNSLDDLREVSRIIRLDKLNQKRKAKAVDPKKRIANTIRRLSEDRFVTGAEFIELFLSLKGVAGGSTCVYFRNLQRVEFSMIRDDTLSESQRLVLVGMAREVGQFGYLRELDEKLKSNLYQFTFDASHKILRTDFALILTMLGVADREFTRKFSHAGGYVCMNDKEDRGLFLPSGESATYWQEISDSITALTTVVVPLFLTAKKIWADTKLPGFSDAIPILAYASPSEALAMDKPRPTRKPNRKLGESVVIRSVDFYTDRGGTPPDEWYAIQGLPNLLTNSLI